LLHFNRWRIVFYLFVWCWFSCIFLLRQRPIYLSADWILISVDMSLSLRRNSFVVALIKRVEELPKSIRLSLRNEIFKLIEKIWFEINELTEKAEKFLIVWMHLSWSFRLLKVAYLLSSSFVIVYYFHKNHSFFADRVKLLNEFDCTCAQ